MIKGIGIDAVEIPRVAKIIENKPKFVKKILTPDELALLQSLSFTRQVEFFAGRFACKEAFSKAYGTGIGAQLGFQDIEILKTASGAPIVTHSPFKGNVFVSITHTDQTAIAEIILEDISE